MEEVLLKLNEYCQKYYFPVFENNKDLNLMKSMFYNLPGYCCEKGQIYLCRFCLKGMQLQISQRVRVCCPSCQ